MTTDEQFPTFILRVLGNEGGYVNNPKDPGGETNWGIAKRFYPDVDIRNLTRDGAIAIYKRDFWNRINAGSLHPAIAFQVLDFAVNSGIETAVRKLQWSIGVADDGHWGPVSQCAADALSDAKTVVRFTAAKIRFYTRLSTWLTFGAGWMNRVAADLEYAAEDFAS